MIWTIQLAEVRSLLYRVENYNLASLGHHPLHDLSLHLRNLCMTGMGSHKREVVLLRKMTTAINGGVDHQVIGIQDIDIAETLTIMMKMMTDNITITTDGVTE